MNVFGLCARLSVSKICHWKHFHATLRNQPLGVRLQPVWSRTDSRWPPHLICSCKHKNGSNSTLFIEADVKLGVAACATQTFPVPVQENTRLENCNHSLIRSLRDGGHGVRGTWDFIRSMELFSQFLLLVEWQQNHERDRCVGLSPWLRQPCRSGPVQPLSHLSEDRLPSGVTFRITFSMNVFLTYLVELDELILKTPKL